MFIYTNKVPANMQIYSDNWPILCKNSSTSMPELMNAQKPLPGFLAEPPQPMIWGVRVHGLSIPVDKKPVRIMPNIPQL